MEAADCWPVLCARLSTRCEQGMTLLAAAPDEETVHDLRVVCKRLRAAWQLLRPWQDGRLCHTRNRAAADLAASLAGTRDADVLLDTLERLRQKADAPTRKALKQLKLHWQAELPQRSTALPPDLLGLRPPLECEQQLWLAMAHLQPPAGWLGLGLQRIRHKCSLLAAEASAGPQLHEPFHAWRKWVKYELYASQLADAASSERLEALDRLGSLLGKLHDLTELEARLALLPAELAEPVMPLLQQQISERKQQALDSRNLW